MNNGSGKLDQAIITPLEKTYKPILPKIPDWPVGVNVNYDIPHGGIRDGDAICYVCDAPLQDGLRLVNDDIRGGSMGLPAKIQKLMGESFMVVVTDEDVICRTCLHHFRQMHKMEIDLKQLKLILRAHLLRKYRIYPPFYEPPSFSCEKEKKKPSNVVIKYGKGDKGKTNICDNKPQEPTPYKCTMCDLRFESNKHLKRHKLKDHLTTWTCHFCQEVFDAQLVFTQHIKTHLDTSRKEQPLTGDVCDETFRATQALLACDAAQRQDVMEVDKVRGVLPSRVQFTCTICDLEFLQEDLYNDHKQTHEALNMLGLNGLEKPEGLSLDGFGTNSESVDLMDINIFENSATLMDQFNRFVCGECETEHDSITEMNEHIQAVHRINQCSVCPEVVGTKAEVAAHVALVHGQPEVTAVPPEQVERPRVPSDSEVIASVARNEREAEANVGLTEGEAETYFGNVSGEGEADAHVENVGLTEGEAEAYFGNVPTEGEAEDDVRNVGPSDGETVAFTIQKDVDDLSGDHEDNEEVMDVPQDENTESDSEFVTCEKCGAVAETQEVLTAHQETCGLEPSDGETADELSNIVESNMADFSEDAGSTIVFEETPASIGKKPKLYPCRACGDNFLSKIELQDHEMWNPNHLLVACPDCCQTFPREKELNVHRSEEHESMRCRYCTKSFTNLKQVKAHERRHVRASKTSYQCDVCQRTFQTQTGYRHHIAEHTGEFKYTCEFCGKGFVSRVRAEEHRACHTKEKRYTCDICDMQFSVQATYWIHRKWHENPKPYKCTECDMTYKHSSLLAIHRRKHTGERPYVCQYCHQSFTVSNSLKRHLSLHTGTFPYTCDICQVGFSAKHKKAQHMSKLHNDHQLLNEQKKNKSRKLVMAVKESEDTPKATTEPVPEVENEWEMAVQDAQDTTAVSSEKQQVENKLVFEPESATKGKSEQSAVEDQWVLAEGSASGQYLTLEGEGGEQIMLTESMLQDSGVSQLVEIVLQGEQEDMEIAYQVQDNAMVESLDSQQNNVNG